MKHVLERQFAHSTATSQAQTGPRPPSRGGGVLLLFGLLCGILIIGWLYRHDEFMSPTHNFGYALGIVGGTMLLLVLLYPLRKRMRFMRNWAPVAPWFRWHMVFGCLGPAIIVVHANFGAQSLNGLMALTSILIVAGSGVVGRFLYVRIHRGLYGAKLEARELLSDAQSARPGIEIAGGPTTQGMKDELSEIERQALAPSPSLSGALRKAINVHFSTKGLEHRLRESESRRLQSANVQPWESFKESMIWRERYFKALRRAGSLTVYERLFALWHVLHLPLLVLLVFTAITHVIAVHLY